MYISLEQEVELAVQHLRERLAAANVGSFSLRIVASGRVSAGDVKIRYSVGDPYSNNDPTGGRLAPVVDEYLRRKGWTEANAPLAISHDTRAGIQPPSLKPANDLPF